MGRKPQPLRILEINGSSQLRRKGIKGKVEPEAPAGRPDDPPLPQYAADLYRQVLTNLENTPGLLSKLDGPQLERYARFFVRWRLVEAESEKMIATAGSSWAVLAQEPKDGKSMRAALRGLWAESRRLDQAMKEIENAFGMSPTARRGLAVEAKPKLAVGTRAQPPA